MKRLKLFVLVFTVWTYGSEALDTLAARTEQDDFLVHLQCRGFVENGKAIVLCLDAGELAKWTDPPKVELGEE